MTTIQKAREALTDLLETLKIHKASVLDGMTKREIQFLMDAMHKGNAALAALDAETAVKANLTRPIIGIENRTAQEAFDIMCDRIRSALVTPEARS